MARSRIIESLRGFRASHLVERSWAIGALALVVYIALAAPCVVAADNADSPTLGALGGRAHPSDTAYVLVARVVVAAWHHARPQRGARHRDRGRPAIGVLHARAAPGCQAIAATAPSRSSAPAARLRTHRGRGVRDQRPVAALVVWLAAMDGPLRGRWRGVALAGRRLGLAGT